MELKLRVDYSFVDADNKYEGCIKQCKPGIHFPPKMPAWVRGYSLHMQCITAEAHNLDVNERYATYMYLR